MMNNPPKQRIIFVDQFFLVKDKINTRVDCLNSNCLKRR